MLRTISANAYWLAFYDVLFLIGAVVYLRWAWRTVPILWRLIWTPSAPAAPVCVSERGAFAEHCDHGMGRKAVQKNTTCQHPSKQVDVYDCCRCGRSHFVKTDNTRGLFT